MTPFNFSINISNISIDNVNTPLMLQNEGVSGVQQVWVDICSYILLLFSEIIIDGYVLDSIFLNYYCWCKFDLDIDIETDT